VDMDTLLVLAVTHWVILQASETEDLNLLVYFLVKFAYKNTGYIARSIIKHLFA
jgi:hypothetical protein